ncbi:NACHT domain-containing protein [Actinomadura litoris]|uniref:Uncharacterized protein n=1 Tax=Actinomadura litoris TaxID=2678616 RepID=A0A7K1L917_9ACTN|nr:hypothetical protein [Actinomadura litoris]MUN40813.1 hypothetical protein [Actinomadura litoris]
MAALVDFNSLRVIIENSLAQTEGNAFQELCDRLCLELYPDDYHPVRPGGRRGDTKNDGYCPKARIFFAAHATRGETAKKTIKKITSDLEGCLENHRDVAVWRYLTNDTLTGQVDQHIDNVLRPSNPSIVIEVWGHKRLADVISRLKPAQIERVIQISLNFDFRDRVTEYLLEEARVYRGRLVGRWLAAGLSYEKASELADDESIGAYSQFENELSSPGLTFIVGDFGSGKSVTALRIYGHSIQAALQDENARLPIFLPVQEISGSLIEAVRRVTDRFPERRANGLMLVVDGLEEPGLGAAAVLLEQIQTLAHSNPENKVIVTTRPGPKLTGGTVCQHPIMTDEEAGALVERLDGNQSMLWTHTHGISEMLHLPLFLIIATIRQQGGEGIPRSKGAFLAALAQEVLGPPSTRATEIEKTLKRIARLSMEYGGPVPVAELEDDAYLPQALATRFVLRRRSIVTFALPILQQYFAARSALETNFTDEELEDLTLMDRWRYALLLAVTEGSWRQGRALIERLIERVPGLAAWLVKNAIPAANYKSEVPLPDDLECARRVRSSLSSWVSAFDFPEMFGFSSHEGVVSTVGARVSDNHLHVGLKVGSRNQGIVRLPRNPNEAEADGSIWSPICMGEVPADFMAWPWQWALSILTRELGTLLRSKALPLPNCEAYSREREWALARAIMGKRDVLHEPLAREPLVESAENLLGLLSEENRQHFIIDGVRPFTGTRDELAGFANKLSSLTDQNIQRPYVVPDNLSPESGLIEELYSERAMSLLVSQVFNAALEIYSVLVDIYFSRFAPTLGLACMRPIEITGVLRSMQGDYFKWSLSYEVKPIPDGRRSNAKISLSGSSGRRARTREEFIEKYENLSRLISDLRPNAKHWAQPRSVQTGVHMFKDMPATALAYRWLWDDLKDLSLMDNAAPYGED